MSGSKRAVLVGLTVMLAVLIVGIAGQTVNSQPPAVAVSDVKPPADQTYIGVKQCSACHFKQFMTWKKSKHATESFAKLPAKYKTDASCLACHSTGYGAATGFKDEASTPNLAGTTCEACHGPGSKHQEIAKKYANAKLTPEQEKEVRGSTYKVLPHNVCASCHASLGHKPHPTYDKE
jgi:mono/diheme cytochrome c family protein